MTNGLFRVASAIPHGVSAQPVFLDVHVAQGLPSFTIVGVADEGCRNTRDRIRAAVINSGFQWPARRVTVGVSPTGVTPPTAVLDLPIALALLTATSQLTIPSGHEMITAFGELGLDGSVRPVVGHLPILRSVEGERVIAPAMRFEPTSRPPGCAHAIEIQGLTGLQAAIDCPLRDPDQTDARPITKAHSTTEGFDQLHGLSELEQALTVAIAGGHHTLIVGSNGSGKTRLLGALSRLVPDLNDDEWHEQILIRSAAGVEIDNPAAFEPTRPVRVVDPNFSLARLVGGMTKTMRPGEFSLAHRGLLVLDDLHLFADQALQALATTLDTRTVKVARAARSVELPGDFQLVAAAPRCPCGARTQPDCHCSSTTKARFLAKLHGSLLDRFDIVINLDQLDGFDPMYPVRDLVIHQTERQPVSDEALSTVVPIDGNARDLLETDGRLSRRGAAGAWRVAWTVQQLRGRADPIDLETLLEAISLRLGNPDDHSYLHEPDNNATHGSCR